MAIDNTPPRLKLIVTIAVITVITLVAIEFAFKSYYATMSDIAYREKIAPTTDREDQHKAELASLSGGAMPVEKAMAQLAGGGRPAAIAPQASDDLGAVTGWSKLPHPAPAPLAPAAHDATMPKAEDGGAPAVDADGGAMATVDGGALPLATDAGASPNAAKPDAGKQH